MYDHVLVDEAQDLHASQWRLLRALAHDGDDNLFIVGDAFQRIYGDTVSLRSLGIETRGRSLRLRRNYRTTHEIAGWALGVIGDETVVDIDELGADMHGYHSVRHGPAPQFAPYADRPAELDGLVATVREWLADGYEPAAVAIAARTKPELEEIVTAVQRAGVPAALLGRKGRVEGAVNVATMHRLKGLEYSCVAVSGLAADVVPPAGAICPIEEDRAQHDADLQTERSLIYVAATRARDQLAVTWAGDPTPLIPLDLAVAVA
jgi:superfamily I DNA/RNA helicase